MIQRSACLSHQDGKNRCSRHQGVNVGLLRHTVVSDDGKFDDVRATFPPSLFSAAADRSADDSGMCFVLKNKGILLKS